MLPSKSSGQNGTKTTRIMEHVVNDAKWSLTTTMACAEGKREEKRKEEERIGVRTLLSGSC